MSQSKTKLSYIHAYGKSYAFETGQGVSNGTGGAKQATGSVRSAAVDDAVVGLVMGRDARFVMEAVRTLCGLAVVVYLLLSGSC